MRLHCLLIWAEECDRWRVHIANRTIGRRSTGVCCVEADNWGFVTLESGLEITSVMNVVLHGALASLV